MTSGPVLVGIISGPKVIETWRTMMGATRPEEALPGTIRGDFAKLLEKMRLSKMLCMVQIQKSQLSEKLLFGLTESSKKFDVRVTCIKLFCILE